MKLLVAFISLVIGAALGALICYGILAPQIPADYQQSDAFNRIYNYSNSPMPLLPGIAVTSGHEFQYVNQELSVFCSSAMLPIRTDVDWSDHELVYQTLGRNINGHLKPYITAFSNDIRVDYDPPESNASYYFSYQTEHCLGKIKVYQISNRFYLYAIEVPLPARG